MVGYRLSDSLWEDLFPIRLHIRSGPGQNENTFLILERYVE